MPIYEYCCSVCGKFEVHQKITDEPIKVCPDCSKDVVKVISTTSPPKFNGTGFYSTDYCKPSKSR